MSSCFVVGAIVVWVSLDVTEGFRRVFSRGFQVVEGMFDHEGFFLVDSSQVFLHIWLLLDLGFQINYLLMNLLLF